MGVCQHHPTLYEQPATLAVLCGARDAHLPISITVTDIGCIYGVSATN